MNELEHTVEVLPDDVEELHRIFITEGGNPSTKPFQAAEMRAVDKARVGINNAIQRQEQAMHPAARFARNFVLRGIEAIAVFFTVILVLCGMAFGSILLVIAETAAVYKGFLLIEANGLLAFLYATTTVLFFLTVLFIREIIAQRSENEPQPLFSLRLVIERLIYFLGIRRFWAVEYRQRKPLLVQIDAAIVWLMRTIIVFGLLGRLGDRLAGLRGNWVDALGQLATQSTLSEMLALFGALIMTIALLLATHFIVYFVHTLYVRVTGGGLDVTTNFTDGLSLEAEIERERINLYKTQILMLRTRSNKNS